jgi:hypothetical protein
MDPAWVENLFKMHDDLYCESLGTLGAALILRLDLLHNEGAVVTFYVSD